MILEFAIEEAFLCPPPTVLLVVEDEALTAPFEDVPAVLFRDKVWDVLFTWPFVVPEIETF